MGDTVDEDLTIENAPAVPDAGPAVHKRYPNSSPPRTYCGLLIGEQAANVTGSAQVSCPDCLRLM